MIYYFQSNTLFLANVFANIQNMHLEIYKLDPALFLAEPGSAWKGASKSTKVKLDLPTDFAMLLIVQKYIRSGIRLAIHPCVKANSKCMKDSDKIKELLYLKY